MSANHNIEIDLNSAPATIEQFVQNIHSGILAYVECECGYKTFLANTYCPICKKEHPDTAKWKKIESPGTIVSYCVTYVSPPELSDIVPYVSLIADFGDNLRISAILKEKIDPAKPPTDLIGKKIIPDFIERPNGKILGMKLQ